MANRDIQAAWSYHAATKHSAISIRTDRFYLDWSNKPFLFKVYTDLPVVDLPRDMPFPERNTLAAITTPPPSETEGPLNLTALAQVLFFSAGLTKKKTLANGEAYYFRAAACAGALYPIEIYAVTADMAGLPAGVYHFNPGDFKLRRLRAGDWRGELVRATAGDRAIAQAPVTLVLTGIYWRSAWKYRARSYRYLFWDSGTIAANLLATAHAAARPARVVMGFLDEPVNRLLGLDTAHEVALELVPLGGPPTPGRSAPDAPAVPLLAAQTPPLSDREVDYPEIHRMHAASTLAEISELQQWKAATPPERARPEGAAVPLRPLDAASWPPHRLGDVIIKRGSTRQFSHRPITLAQLSTLLDQTTQGIPADFLPAPGSSLLDIYLIVHAVEGLESGSYYFSPREHTLHPLAQGDMRRTAGYLGLEQPLAADAAVTVFFMANLHHILSQYGNRGYRATQFEAGLTGGKMYLAAYHLGLGATGLTFYDDDVTQFFSPHAADKTAIFVTAIGYASRQPLPQGHIVPLVTPPSAPPEDQR